MTYRRLELMTKILQRFGSDPSAPDVFVAQVAAYLGDGGHITDLHVVGKETKGDNSIAQATMIEALRRRVYLAEQHMPDLDWDAFYRLGKAKGLTLAEMADAIGKSPEYLREFKTTNFVPVQYVLALLHAPTKKRGAA